ncbi:MAG: hypothetical protein L6R30_05850 [Thermoanaerobaculia bacterium]|nr:hypothetical protein [Thermoanaerobaculia bacterium]MCK6681930.1 hypothetical protein [Thermoanaerobaculia bacterium]
MREARLTGALLLLFGTLSVLGQTASLPPATPVPPAPAELLAKDPRDGRYLASLEVKQGDAVERTAVFENGMVDFRWYRPGRPVVKNRFQLPRIEIEAVRRVLEEGSRGTLADLDPGPQNALVPGRRTFRIELSAVVAGEARIFEFDEMRRLPLTLGRIRGALEDLRGQLVAKEAEGRAKSWDPAGVQIGDRLIRRTDGTVFVVTKNDPFGNMLELEDEARHLERSKIRRVELPAVFELVSGEVDVPPHPAPTVVPSP